MPLIAWIIYNVRVIKLARGIILFGIILLALSAYDEHRGIASVMSLGRYPVRLIVKKSEKPDEYRDLMTYQWIRGFLVVLLGLIGIAIYRRMDRLDPFSPDFAGNPEVDELAKTLDKERRNP